FLSFDDNGTLGAPCMSSVLGSHESADAALGSKNLMGCCVEDTGTGALSQGQDPQGPSDPYAAKLPNDPQMTLGMNLESGIGFDNSQNVYVRVESRTEQCVDYNLTYGGRGDTEFGLIVGDSSDFTPIR